jgi:hypothetical protein
MPAVRPPPRRRLNPHLPTTSTTQLAAQPPNHPTKHRTARPPGAFAITVGLWIFGGSLGVNAVAAAIVGLFILLVGRGTWGVTCMT